MKVKCGMLLADMMATGFNGRCVIDLNKCHLPFGGDCYKLDKKDEQPGGSCPSQYALPEGATDLQDLIEFRDMNFAEGNIFKATYRKGTCSHSDRLRDMRKIKWFAEREIARLEKEK